MSQHATTGPRPAAWADPDRRGHTVALLGCGNICSQLVPLLAMLPSLSRLIIADRDSYETSNLASQAIVLGDVGKPKALVQARTARRLNPQLQVIPLVGDIAVLPLGQLRADVLVGALDNGWARMALNEAAWMLGRPWIDTAVDGAAWLARVDVYTPSDGPCYECGYSDADYDAAGWESHCLGAGRPAPTNAPRAIGALAAALGALECQKVLQGDWPRTLAGRELLQDVRHHKHYVSALRRNPACRFHHETYPIAALAQGPAELSLGAAFALGAPGADALRHVRGTFVRRLTCPGCGRSAHVLRLSHRLGRGARRCRHCGGAMEAGGFDHAPWLDRYSVPGAAARRSLASLGFQPGDVFAVREPERTTYYELASTPAPDGPCS